MPSVDDPAPGIGLRLNAAVEPAGWPLTARFTAPLKPLIAVVVTVYSAVSPAAMPAACGVTERPNSCVLSTTRPTVAVCVRPSPVAEMVRFAVVDGVPADVVTVSVDEPEPLMVVGLNEAVVPGGSPTGPPSCTGPLKVPGLTVTVYVALWPEETVRDEGVALSVNLGAFTTRFTVRCRTMRPLVAVMVSGYVPAGVWA